MTEEGRQGRFRRRSIDYLGDLGAKLRDLQGFATLGRELVQNADDAGATQIVFDVRDDGVVVDNNGTFSDCGDIDAPECPWRSDEGKGHRCDFHRIQSVAGGDKRGESDTTGAFGFGFTAVYQITDRPELISAGRHWAFQEELEEDKRIFECDGCKTCKSSALPGTRFVLPWARDPGSRLRQALRVAPVSADAPSEFLEEIEQLAPKALLFLRKVAQIEVKRDGRTRHKYTRVDIGEDLEIDDGGKAEVWHLVKGNFDVEAAELRREFPVQIEETRSSSVTIAIPEIPLQSGLLYAFLPTQHETGLPFHIHADFFPSSGRKTVIFESEYQSEWNRAAIDGAAQAFQQALPSLPERLGHRRLWNILQAIFQVKQQVSEEAGRGQRDRSFGRFWERVSPGLSTCPIMRTTAGRTCEPRNTLLLQLPEEDEAIPVLEALGIQLVDKELRSSVFQLPRSGVLGIELLDVGNVVEALRSHGLTTRREQSDFPEGLRSKTSLGPLWVEFGRLLGKTKSEESLQDLRSQVAACAIAMGRDGAVYPCDEVYSADDETVELFSALDSNLPYLADLAWEGFDVVDSLCPQFTASSGAEAIRGIEKDRLEAMRKERKLDIARLIGWFEDRRSEVLRTPGLKQSVAGLPIYPSASGLHALADLFLPGDFRDPLGLAEVVDLDLLEGRREFLKELGAKELTFRTYARDQVPRALSSCAGVEAERKREVVVLLASRLGEILEEPGTREALAGTPIVECEDGVFRRPDAVYFRGPATADVLGKAAHYACVPAEHTAAIQAFYEWIGVAATARAQDIVDRVRQLVAKPPQEATVSAIRRIVEHLGPRMKGHSERLRRGEQELKVLLALKPLAWLPAKRKRDTWRTPDKIYSSFREYLFETQADFLDLPTEVQASCSDLLDFLGVESNPTVPQVVAHLLKCSESQKEVNKQVYDYLNLHHDDEAVQRLIGKRCILLPNGSYVAPRQVFWNEHPFGQFRFQLKGDLWRYKQLFDAIGVHGTPNSEDARQVLLEAGEEYGRGNKVLDEDARAVVLGCWQMLDRVLGSESIQSASLRDLAEEKVIVDGAGVLARPNVLFFEDRGGLAAKFGRYLQQNVIPRLEGSWHAMLAAGVRLLSNAVQSRLIECVDPTPDGHIEGVLRERRLQIARVLEAQTGDSNGSDGARSLSQLRFLAVKDLKIQYSLDAFKDGRPQASDPEMTPAHLLRDESVLYVVRTNGQYPWTAIARELAIALCPSVEPGRLASGIKEVLAAQSEEEARTILDELGFPPMHEVKGIGHVEGGYIVDLGGEEAPEVEVPEAGGGTDETEPPNEERDVEVQGGELHGPNGRGANPMDAVRGILGPETGQPTPIPTDGSEETTRGKDARGAGGGAGPRSGMGTGTAGGKNPASQSRIQGRLSTYVVHGTGDAGGQLDPSVLEQRDATEQAGIEKVLDYETRMGRSPKKMPVNHPGYDVESCDAAGRIVRYIEVKACTGVWGTIGVGVTRTEFDKSQDLGERYWLYVVERAQEADARLWRIHDPGRRAEKFLYDHGWQALAEPDDGSPEPSGLGQHVGQIEGA